MPKGVFMVFTHCTDPAREEEFNRWYSHTHLPDLSASKGAVRSRRFRNINPNGQPDKYLALYEFDSPDIKESIGELIGIAVEAHAKGRHIDFIEGGTAFICEEIDPNEFEPLEEHNYPTEVPDRLTQARDRLLN